MEFKNSFEEINAKMTENNIPTQTRKSIMGMLKSWGNGQRDAVDFLQRNGIVNVTDVRVRDRNFDSNKVVVIP